MQVEAASEAAGLSAIVACVGVIEEMAIPQLDFLLEGMHARGQSRVQAADLQQLLLFRRAFTPEELSRLGSWAASAKGRIVPQRLPGSCMVWSDHGEGRTIRSDLLGSRPVVCFRVPLDLALVLARVRTQDVSCFSAGPILRWAIQAGRLGVVQQLLAFAPPLLDYEVGQSIQRNPGEYDCEPLYIACSVDGLPLDTRLEMVRTLVSAYRARATQQGVEGPIFYVINRAMQPSAEYRALQAARERGCDDIVSFLIESGVPFDSSAHTDPGERRAIDFILTPHRFSVSTLNLNSGGNVMTPERIEQARQLFGRSNAMAFGYLVGKLNLEDHPPPGGWGSLDPDEVRSRALRDAIESEAQIRDLRSQMLFAETERLRGDLLREQREGIWRQGELLLTFVCNPDATDEALPQALNDALAASQAIPASIIGGTVFAAGRQTAQEAQTADRDCTFERLEAELRNRSESRRKPSYFLFSGHANVLSEGREKRLGFTTSSGSFAPADNDRVASLLGRHAFSGDGGIRLVVLNGCESLDLARACRAQGVPAVVCWETVVPDEAAYLFVRGFFRKLAESQDFERAFDAGKEAVGSKTRTVPVRGASGEAVTRRAVPFFELADPDRVRLLPSGSYAAGVPVLLTAEAERR